ncbi:GntR family transcriptional regulator [Actinomyces sp.]|uniref:GntR family transcriptional regulator n=1 Tax=Actinomyces sp. TaxID=29317 RepID=UPI00290A9167|nr:GntR family transcriptional regulator [Actinomyces sp.]MDU5569393.1 GntR family transcriptional regulator [Actinomyces sp.]MDU7239654.1 GntR family transcriptional regulator [Actinomyces sp.]
MPVQTSRTPESRLRELKRIIPEVDRSSAIPTWAQVEKQMRVLISAIYDKGDQLPSESELAELFDVSRVTVRRAIGDLVLDGTLVRRQGSGTFVKRPISTIEHNLGLTSHWTGRLEEQGHQASSEEIERSLEASIPLDFVPEKQLQVGEEYLRISRLHAADGKAIGFVDSWIDVDVVPEALTIELEKGSLSKAFQKHGVNLVSAGVSLSLDYVTKTEADLINLSIGDPVFVVMETTKRDDKVAYISRTLWNANRVRFWL